MMCAVHTNPRQACQTLCVRLLRALQLIVQGKRCIPPAEFVRLWSEVVLHALVKHHGV